MKVLVHDFAGHPFQVELSRELARRGHSVVHAHCPTYASGKGALERVPSDPDGFQVAGLALPRFDKHSFARRLWQEARYGAKLGKLIEASRPDAVISANAPLLAQSMGVLRAHRSGAAFVFWHQDIISLAVARLASDRLSSPIARALATPLRVLEAWSARRSDAIIPISTAYVPTLLSWGVDEERISVIENWAPLDDLPTSPRDNAWAEEHGLANRRVVLYSGTLGLKHGSQQLGELAQLLSGADVTVVVVSGGDAATRLEQWATARNLTNVLVLPFQRYERLAEVLGSADVLLALLDERAGELSVPSKVLSYLCAGRPIIAAMPASNLAARTIEAAEAGVVIPVGDVEALASSILRLLDAPDTRRRLGANGRAYAEVHFAISGIADRFEGLLEAAVARRQRFRERRFLTPVPMHARGGKPQ